MALFTHEEALNYHRAPRPGKLEVIPVKPCETQKDLSMAYSPGVADACMAIHADPSTAADAGKVRAVPATAGTYRGIAIAEEKGVDGQLVLCRPYAAGDVVVSE